MMKGIGSLQLDLDKQARIARECLEVWVREKLRQSTTSLKETSPRNALE